MKKTTLKLGYKKIKWLFGTEIEIPEEWDLITIKKLGDIVTGNTPSTEHSSYYGGHIPFFKPADLNSGYHVVDSVDKLSEEGLTKARLIPKKSILVSCIGIIGKIGFNLIAGATNQQINTIIPKSNVVIPEYLYFACISLQFQIQLLKNSSSTVVPIINKSKFSKLTIQFPPLKEQQKIASILSNVDALIESTQKVIDDTKSLKTGLIQKLLTRGIRHKKFKKVLNFFRKEFQVPYEWKIKQFNDVVKTNLSVKVDQDIVPYIPMDAVDVEKPHFNYYEKRKLSKNKSLPKFQENDVLLARITPSTENGKTCIIENFKFPGIASSELTVLRAFKEVIPKYLYYYVKSHRIRQFAISQMMGSTGRQRVPESVFKKDLNFELPTLVEQQKIASILSDVDAYIQKNQECKEKLERLKTGLMQKLLTGQIRVSV